MYAGWLQQRPIGPDFAEHVQFTAFTALPNTTRHTQTMVQTCANFDLELDNPRWWTMRNLCRLVVLGVGTACVLSLQGASSQQAVS